MSKILTNDDFAAGDVLLFSSTGITSRVIALGTVPPIYWFRDHWRNVKHAEICSGRFPRALYPRGGILSVGSTTQCDEPCVLTGKRIDGVQAHRPEDRCNSYPGRVYRMRPAPRRFSRRDEWRLTWFLRYWIGKRYDMRGAVSAPAEFWQLIPDPKAAFCSELVAMAAMELGLLPLSNPRKIAPSRLARDLVQCGTYLVPERLK